MPYRVRQPNSVGVGDSPLGSPKTLTTAISELTGTRESFRGLNYQDMLDHYSRYVAGTLSAGRVHTLAMVGLAGFEPATFAVSGRRPNQASPTLLERLRRPAPCRPRTV